VWFMVRVRYSFGSRHTGRLGNIRKQRKGFPKIMQEVIEMSDIVLEILDARFVGETRNLEVEEMVERMGKRLVYVFNKCDLVDAKKVKSEVAKRMTPYVFVSATKGIGLGELKARIKMEAKRVVAMRRESKKDGLGGQEANWDRVHVGVMGVPNAGKSSVINLVTRRGVASVGANAGWTKGMQKIRMSEGILVLDTPGVIPVSRYTTRSTEFAADVKIGARSYGDVRDPAGAVSYLMIREKVKTDGSGLDENGEFEITEDGKRIAGFYGMVFGGDVDEFVGALGRKRGFLLKGGIVDEDRAARLILKDWQEGRIDA
jgi:ribosome biogenesis GTPase A